MVIYGETLSNLKMKCYYFIITSAGGRAVYGSGVRPLDCWDCGYEPG